MYDSYRQIDVTVADRVATVTLNNPAKLNGAVIWPQLVGYARAKEFVMTGDSIPAPKAAEMGLINHAVPDEALDGRVADFAGRLRAGAAKAIRSSKVSVNIGLKQLAHSIMDTSLAYEALSDRTVAASLERRSPNFQGRR